MNIEHLLRLGTSGWSYKDWLSVFYPAKLPQDKWLEFYSQHFNTVEVDSTFYGIPPRSRFEKWAETVPAGFEFALKIPQVITHEKSLINCDTELREFLHGASALGEKLGPLLFQFPYSFKPERLSDLLTFLDTLPGSPFRFAVEIRNRSWLKSPLPVELTARKIPLVSVDHPWMPRDTRITADFAYIRWLGDQDKIQVFDKTQLDKKADLHWWAEEVSGILGRKIPVYGFFNNHFSGHAPDDIKAFTAIINQYRPPAEAG